MSTPVVAPPEAFDAEVVVMLDRPAAEKLDGRIRRLVAQVYDQQAQVRRLLDEARRGHIHRALGFTSWTAYVADVCSGTLELSGEVRRTMVALMSSEDMSLRAIATATGVSKDTVSRDLAKVSHDETPAGAVPATVTGLDGKTHPRHRPAPREPRQPRPSLRGNYTSDVTPLRRALRGVPDHVAQFDKFADDERFCEWLVGNDSRVADVRREIAKAIEHLRRMDDRIQQAIDVQTSMRTTP